MFSHSGSTEPKNKVQICYNCQLYGNVASKCTRYFKCQFGKKHKKNKCEKQPTDYKCPNGGKIYQIIKSQCEQYLFENVNINKRLSHSGNTKPIFT